MSDDSMDKPLDEGEGLQTWFASARRADSNELLRQIYFISNNEIMSGMLSTISGLMAVLNEQRQILAVNDNLCRLLGIGEMADAFGLRPGEALHCAHATDNSGGCGTSRFCASCGAAIAITTSLATDSPVERKCALTARNGSGAADFCIQVKAVTVKFSGERFVLLFLQDITAHELRSSLERTFFHDIEQSLQSINKTVELMSAQGRTDSLYLLDKLKHVSGSLIREVQVQNSMILNSFEEITVVPEPIRVNQLLREINDLFFNHPEAKGKNLRIETEAHETVFFSDLAIVVRVISNMILNALEATGHGGEIILRIVDKGDGIAFKVWNGAVISRSASLRVFQHYFSTKEEPGRGVGTYAMKVFGENILGGKVSFTSAVGEGTWFNFMLPKGEATA